MPAETRSSAQPVSTATFPRSEEHTSELQSHLNLVCRLLLEKKKNNSDIQTHMVRKCGQLHEKRHRDGHFQRMLVSYRDMCQVVQYLLYNDVHKRTYACATSV